MRSTIRCFLCVNALIFLLNIATLSAQSLLPEQEGQRARFSAYIEIRDAYLSGGCMLLNDGNLLKGAVFNDFGISYFDFSYHFLKEKVKLHDVQKMMNKWYLKKILKKDLKALIHNMREGLPEYRDEKYRLYFKLTPIPESETEDADIEE